MATIKTAYPTFSEAQTYSFPDLGVAVQATSHQEAVEKANKLKEKQANE